MALLLVLLPYEITLLSNKKQNTYHFLIVLLPYEITLLSNVNFGYSKADYVLLPYEITLLSNLIQRAKPDSHSFTTL